MGNIREPGRTAGGAGDLWFWSVPPSFCLLPSLPPATCLPTIPPFSTLPATIYLPAAAHLPHLGGDSGAGGVFHCMPSHHCFFPH